MTRLVLEQVTDFGDFSNGKDFNELLSQTNSNHRNNNLSDVRVSPDGRHIHFIQRKPKVGLLTFDKYSKVHLIQNSRHLNLGPARTVPIVDIAYLNQTNNYRDGSAALAAVVFENGKAEFWEFLECKAGWHLLQTSDLCDSHRARVVSVSACSNLMVWCEERPPSESSSALNTSNDFRYCICKRSYEVEEGAVVLGAVKIALHNNPRYVVISSGESAYLLPDPKEKPALSVSRFFLAWDPQHDTLRVGSTSKGMVLRKDSTLAKDCDFKKLITDSLGYLSALDPPDIYGFAPISQGGLLLLLSSGWVSLLQRDGMLRQVYKLADNFSIDRESHISLNMYHGTLALTIGPTLYLIDSKCGRELEKISLKREGILYTDQSQGQSPHLLSELGLFVVMHQESDPRGHYSEPRPSSLGTAESIVPGALLVEAVFEEACKYYQQRSLSSTQLTVEKLKKGGMFQAPISLASIVRDYLCGGGGPKGGELPQGNSSRGVGGQDKLLCSLEAELKGLVSLEEVKESLVRGKEKEVQAVCESLVQQEVVRLLSSTELERSSLLYLNSIFSLFPCPAWRATQAAMQLSCSGEGSLSSGAPPEVWKTVLTPPPSGPANLPHTNGQTKRKPSIHRAGSAPSSSPPAANLALPVFELLCHSVFLFQASWLPQFLEVAQQQQASAGLGLSLSSSWGYSGGRGGEAGESARPLYKRALSVLPVPDKDPDPAQNQELEVELLLVSGRPNAVLQALRLLMGRRQWERVTMLAQRFCQQSPLLNKEIFTTLLCEVAQHRDLDPYLDLLWALCPEDLTVTSILNLVLKTIPSSNPPTSPSSSPSSPAPFADPQASQLTLGLLKPLLRKVLQRETKPSQRYADILQSPSFPPPTPPRQAAEPRATTEASLSPAPEPTDNHMTGPREGWGPEPSKHRTGPLGTVMTSALNAV